MTSTTNRSFSLHPMLILVVCLAAGILIDKFVVINPALAVCAAAAFAAAALALRRRAATASYLIAVAWVAAGAVLSVSERMAVRADRVKVLYDSGSVSSGSPVEIEGVVTNSPEPSVEGDFLAVDVERLRTRGRVRTASGRVRIFVLSLRTSPLRYGSRVRVACELEREDGFRNPGVLGRREILERLGVDAGCSVKSPLLIEHIADESVFVPLSWTYDARRKLINEFRERLGPRAAGVMIASLLGDKHFLDKDTADIFRDGGTFHILVISGLHITFIGGLLYWLARRFTRQRAIQFTVTNSVLWAYTLAVGADIPVVRAAVMFTVISFSYVIYRRSSLLNSFGLSCLILLVWRPSDLFNPSFQLTVVSVAAIVVCAYPLISNLRKIGEWAPSAQAPLPPNVLNPLRRFCETLYWRDAAWAIERKRHIWTAKLAKTPYLRGKIKGISQMAIRYIFEGALVSLIVQLWMLPLTILYFHRVSFASILLNLWVGLFIALESFAAVAAVFAGGISELLAAGLYAVADGLNWAMLSLPDLISQIGWASFRVPAYEESGSAIYFMYFVPVILLAVALERWRPFELSHHSILTHKRVVAASLLAAGGLAAVIVLHPYSAPRADGRLLVEFLDVGQGDSILLTFPNGQTMLVDGGGRLDYRTADDEAGSFKPDTRSIGESVVSEVLWAKGYSRIDHILATHADSDHMQGLVDVAKNFEIGSAIFARTPETDEDFVELHDVLMQRGVAIETVGRGDRLQFGECIVEILYPLLSTTADASSENDESVVLRLVYGNRAILLTGDIERAAETALLSNGGTLNSDVVKVAHHGSRTSSTSAFVAAARAKYAIVSAGRNSPFGHPHPEVVARWQAAGVQVFTTADNGMISVSTDGRDLTLAAFRPENSYVVNTKR